MLEHHFRSFKAIDRVRSLWLGPQIERYVQWFDERHASNATVRQHVRALSHFNNFVIARGVSRLQDLPQHVDAFVERWQSEHSGWCKSSQDRAAVVAQSRIPVEQMLSVVLPGYTRPSKTLPFPFTTSAPGLYRFLTEERGLRSETVRTYTQTLRPFESYLAKTDIALSAITPACLTNFLNERAKTLHKSAMIGTAATLRVFLRYLHREGITAFNLERSVPRGRVYKEAPIPRAINWQDVERLLASIDRRSSLGKRDYAVLTLLASYGLRAREIAALCLDDFDWKHSQVTIPRRKGGHSTRYPLSATVGEAVIAYLQIRRTDVTHREVFLLDRSPYSPMEHTGVSRMASLRMRCLGIDVARAGSHTLRHACVQRLVECNVSFKVIGDYVGHSRSASTLVYGKVAVHKLREFIAADAENVL